MGLNNFIKNTLLNQGILIMKPCGHYGVVKHKLQRLKERGIEIRSVIDAGAAEGKWAQTFRSVFPNSSVLCIDPRNDVQKVLMDYKRSEKGIEVAQVALGSKEGSFEINIHGDQTSLMNNSENRPFGERVKVRVVPLDSLVRELAFPKPDYIKMDLQGAELEALDGAEACLQTAQAVQLELSWLPFQSGMPLVADVVDYMKKRNFVWYDILNFCHRPLDGAFAQADALFLKEDHPLRASGKWDKESEFS